MFTYAFCTLCPRNCGVDRTAGKTGYCGETDSMRIATIEAHHGEEPPISGVDGSGTVFFSGCTLNCLYCQNYQISCDHMGHPMTTAQVVEGLAALYQKRNIHNVNLVTPDHFILHTIDIAAELKKRSMNIPILFNTSCYMKREIVQLLKGTADIYMPDFKYADAELATALSRCRNYPGIALDALDEMIAQKGFLDSFAEGKPIASKGVIVRHLVLPGHTRNSIDVLSILYNEFGRDLPLSLMSQYWPPRRMERLELNKKLHYSEFSSVYEHAISLGFRHIFVQHLSDDQTETGDFKPDFSRERPFRGNI